MREDEVEMFESPDVAELERRLSSWLPRATGVQGAIASEGLVILDADLRHVARAVAKRRAEFIAGRWCAYRAMEKIGVPFDRLCVNSLGGPLWPAGVTGSITHESGVCLAVATKSARVSGVGIDLLDIDRSSDLDALQGVLLNEREFAASRTLRNNRHPGFLAHVFSAKESVIKSVSSRIGRWMDLREIEVILTDDAFTAHVDGHSCTINGRFCEIGRFILSAAVLQPD